MHPGGIQHDEWQALPWRKQPVDSKDILACRGRDLRPLLAWEPHADPIPCRVRGYCSVVEHHREHRDRFSDRLASLARLRELSDELGDVRRRDRLRGPFQKRSGPVERRAVVRGCGSAYVDARSRPPFGDRSQTRRRGGHGKGANVRDAPSCEFARDPIPPDACFTPRPERSGVARGAFPTSESVHDAIAHSPALARTSD